MAEKRYESTYILNTNLSEDAAKAITTKFEDMVTKNGGTVIETGAFGGKKSDPHKAAVVGDTVGDPFKDTAGPSLHVLIKLLSTLTLVLAPLFI